MKSLYAPTLDEFKHSFAAAELAALPEAIGGVETDAWLSSLLAEACDRVILAVNSCARNQTILTGIAKVPLECRRTVLVLARHAAISAVPGMQQVLEGETRHDEYARACKELDALAACDLMPEYTLTPEEMPEEEEEGTGGGIDVHGCQSPSFLI